MPQRLATIVALLAFAVCLVAGTVAGNPFTTTVGRALAALAVTYAVGLVVGLMTRRVIDENLAAAVETPPPPPPAATPPARAVVKSRAGGGR